MIARAIEESKLQQKKTLSAAELEEQQLAEAIAASQASEA